MGAMQIRFGARGRARSPQHVTSCQPLTFTQLLRRFSEAAAIWDRALAIAPGDAKLRVWRAQVDLESRADMEPGREAVQSILTEDPGAVDVIAERWFYIALCRRDAAEITSALASLPAEIIAWCQSASLLL